MKPEMRDDKYAYDEDEFRASVVFGIKQRALVLVEVTHPNGRATRDVIGRSRFQVINRAIDKERILFNALFNALVNATTRYGIPTGSYISRILRVGYQTGENVTVRRVNVNGRYRQYVYAEGMKGVVSNTKWRPKNDRFEAQSIVDEEDIGRPMEDDRFRNN